MEKIKENFHDLEGTIRQQRLYLTSVSVPLVSNMFAERKFLAEREDWTYKQHELTNKPTNRSNWA